MRRNFIFCTYLNFASYVVGSVFSISSYSELNQDAKNIRIKV
jgi:hypothetical protein